MKELPSLSTPVHVIDDVAEDLDRTIERLAKLRPAEYDRVKKDEAGKLGITVKALDAEIRIKQKEKDLANDAPFKTIEPWPHAIDGADLLCSVIKTIRRYVICSEHTARAATLWITHTYLLDVIYCSPLAIITAPDKGCGKSTLLDVMADMVYQPIPTASISAAALYRTIEEYQPTLLIDEVDSFLAGDEAMRGIINCGHKRKAAFVMRCDGEDNKPKRFSTWAAKLLSGISAKNLHDTITSRAIILELRKKLATEVIASNRNNQDEYHALSRKLVRWTSDIKGQLRQSNVTFPNSLNDRQKDNWESLLAVADIAGGQWPEIARETAVAICSKAETKSYQVELLEDIKAIFELKKIDRVSTANLINYLCEDVEANWATYSHGKQISPKQLAKILGSYGIVSKTVRFGGYATAKGYDKAQFLDAWARYVDVLVTASTENECEPSHTNAGVTQVVTGVTTPPDTSCHASQHLSCNYGESFSQSKTCDGTNEFAVTATPLQHRDRDVYEAVKWGEGSPLSVNSENPDFKSGIRPIL
ncbi:MAG: hypothetical protein B7Y05_09585 [Polynucleobacter sp. 24-46-87]|nr:MAG: hypothetical protein B7Y22_00865 [Polynucleobacter sp. 16-46-70]OZA13523.1 MAG: hypothetical protein B7Y05_09585 [Polynucleobacter sp. 24-46-87]OZA41628.1 MAG: hypothetical protein B7X83_01755 [Polynucleobacter sp. 17-46-58]OZB48740.1 MAG: hypothetical protein B7X60_03260 [Polynucleobacter sp. 39-45-136]HQR83502.1 DUF3631 domain-containing protein [Polynucleobacter sp.]